MTDNYTAAAIYGMKNFTSKVREKVKKEMGKVKLLELLNEYKNDDFEYSEEFGRIVDYELEANIELKIISKQFGFIEWLVQNDKIDFTKLDNARFNQLVDNTLDSYYALLMLLAIQNDAIGFLISILK